MTPGRPYPKCLHQQIRLVIRGKEQECPKVLTDFIGLILDSVVVAEHGKGVRRRRSLLTAKSETKGGQLSQL